MAAWFEFVEESDAFMQAGQSASGPGRRRLFLSDDGQMKLIDEVGAITLLASLFLQAVHNPVIGYADSPYDAVAYETVKVLTLFADPGDIVVRLPSAAGIPGAQVKVISVTPPFTGGLPGGHQIEVQTILAQTINGLGSQFLTNAGENLNLESDGANWLIAG